MVSSTRPAPSSGLESIARGDSSAASSSRKPRFAGPIRRSAPAAADHVSADEPFAKNPPLSPGHMPVCPPQGNQHHLPAQVHHRQLHSLGSDMPGNSVTRRSSRAGQAVLAPARASVSITSPPIPPGIRRRRVRADGPAERRTVSRPTQPAQKEFFPLRIVLAWCPALEATVLLRRRHVAGGIHQDHAPDLTEPIFHIRNVNGQGALSTSAYAEPAQPTERWRARRREPCPPYATPRLTGISNRSVL